MTGVEYYLPEVCHGGGKRALRGDVSRVARVMVHLGGRQGERTVCDTRRLSATREKEAFRGRGGGRGNLPSALTTHCERSSNIIIASLPHYLMHGLGASLENKSEDNRMIWAWPECWCEFSVVLWARRLVFSLQRKINVLCNYFTFHCGHRSAALIQPSILSPLFAKKKFTSF